MSKRQFHVVLPWGNVESTSSDGTLLMEIPEDEPFSYGISHINRSTVVVTIHSGQRPNAEKWCRTTIFTCTDDGSVDRKIFEGESEIDIDPRQTEDWQEWNYSRDVVPSPAYDTFAREYQSNFITSENPANQPALDSTSPNYLDHAPTTTSAVQSLDAEGSVSTQAFDLDENTVSSVSEKVKQNGLFNIEVTQKPPVNPTDKSTGSRVDVQSRSLGWSETRYNGAKARVLGYSAFAESL